jgi:GNAT superfamily N-acetyltransferase
MFSELAARLPDLPRWWDLSIDTLEGCRGRGLARACCEFLIGHMAQHGKRPVWGALEENTPSIRLASSLGFVPVDTLAIFQPEAAP